ncbi:ATP-dependent DNA helicase RecG [Succiniclasticum ruminis]|jgi:ATP-dependent DNA helicase RecG|uniref:ATP-dependent DNA helicase RecG n=1 Tax=Succiniclasticum ruminis TaxID=40841 RepID=A0A1G6LGY5_9FIRM|nr:ATP-binding protein [Succiniclasticum ruminis]SDC42692.1 ATP-dependent DNA helicase RecG [Succiniclasticum ruminis]
MVRFEYNHDVENADYYETLQNLMDRWENEIVEFKEAKGQYSEEKIGQYFSAISNEANLAGKQYGWFVLGVSENNDKHPVGTAFKQGDASLLERVKYTISKDLTDNMTFLDTIELYPVYEGSSCRVLMFKIPAAVAGMPTEWKGRCYARNGESLTFLQQYKIDAIRNQERRDWSKLILPSATVNHLDKDAIVFARSKYKEKMNRPHIAEEVDAMSDEEFLTKLKLMRDGKVTNAAMVLLGNSDYDYLFGNAPLMMWRLYGAEGEMKDYSIFTIPFITVSDRVFAKIRNLTYRYMPNQQSLFPKETEQYDSWLLRELLNNCIAHSNYQLGGRIYVNECEDNIKFTNPGDFLPQTIEAVLKVTYNPPFYRNQLLADAMVKFHMIDTATSGIKKVFRIQKEKYFPLPDYDLTLPNQVSVTVYGKILNEQYTYILFNHPTLDLETVFLLDQVQKGNGKKLPKEAIAFLKKHKLVEGQANNLYLSAEVAKTIDAKAQYIKNKAFNDQYYRDLIVEYLKKYKKGRKQNFRELLLDKLPDVLDDKKKDRKISTLLTTLRQKGIITTDSPNQQISNWILVEKPNNSNKKQ